MLVMAVRERPSDLGANRASGPPTPLSETASEVQALGEALEARITDVLALTVARTTRLAVDAALRDSAERISNTSTIAIARWLAGDDPDAAREACAETWLFYGELAAQRAASLNMVIMHCLCWRDAVAEVLQQSAEQLSTSPEALSQARYMLQIGLEFGFIQLSKAFDGERERTDEELAFRTTHDSLTGLPNRMLTLDRVEQMLVRARRRTSAVTALLLGLDNFKAINDTLGHSAGDQLLRAVAERLDGVVRDIDVLGRHGADEFVVVAEELAPGEGPELLAERLRAALTEPFTLPSEDEPDLTVAASIGIAASASSSAEELLRDADIAMHQAKWDGKNRHVVFKPGMQDELRSRMELETDLRDALSKDEFFLVYQPTFDLRDMSPKGLEALIRWRHATRDIVQPNDFIPLLEATELIIPVGKWVLEQACRQAARWRDAGYSIGMAVNVSARQLDTDQLVTDVKGALADSGLDAGLLTLEITETTLMRDVNEATRRLAAIKELGVRIAIDDFGTGYSSLAYLHRFPVDSLKIDRSFISRLTDSADADTLIHTMVQLGKALSIETVAEGIERDEELSMLQKARCDTGQGFLYARPMDAVAAETFLRTASSAAVRASADAAPRGEAGSPRERQRV